jgi:glutamate synthase (NADPH) small chain
VAGATADSAVSSLIEALHAFGVLRYGIRSYRLPKEIANVDFERLKALGAELARDVIIGRTVTIDQLIDELGYSAVFAGTDAGSPVFMNIPGETSRTSTRQRVPRSRQPGARILVPRIRHTYPAAGTGSRHRRW